MIQEMSQSILYFCVLQQMVWSQGHTGHTHTH